MLFRSEGNQVEIYTDTPWHVAQPHGDTWDLAWSDQALHEWTERIVRADPSFRPMAERAAELSKHWYPD